MSTASSLGKLIKLKCLTGNHAKVKEMLCKLLLAPTFLGVWRRLSADVCGLGSGVAEQSKNVENWIVTVDFAACTSGRKWTFNNSTIWGPGPVSCTTKIPGSLRERHRCLLASLTEIQCVCLRWADSLLITVSARWDISRHWLCLMNADASTQGHKGSVSGLMRIKWWESHAVAITVAQSSAQLNTFVRATCLTALSDTVIRNSKWGSSWGIWTHVGVLFILMNA